jgi:hypothetical protein
MALIDIVSPVLAVFVAGNIVLTSKILPKLDYSRV